MMMMMLMIVFVFLFGARTSHAVQSSLWNLVIMCILCIMCWSCLDLNRSRFQRILMIRPHIFSEFSAASFETYPSMKHLFFNQEKSFLLKKWNILKLFGPKKVKIPTDFDDSTTDFFKIFRCVFWDIPFYETTISQSRKIIFTKNSLIY